MHGVGMGSRAWRGTRSGLRLRLRPFLSTHTTSPQDADAATAAGAAVVGADDLVKAIQAGELNFDRCIATPEVMPLVSRVARVRGAHRFA